GPERTTGGRPPPKPRPGAARGDLAEPRFGGSPRSRAGGGPPSPRRAQNARRDRGSRRRLRAPGLPGGGAADGMGNPRLAGPPRRSAPAQSPGMSEGEGTAGPAPPLVKTEGLGHVYRTGRSEVIALQDLDLELARGETVALVGPSGSGKTTRMKI